MDMDDKSAALAKLARTSQKAKDWTEQKAKDAAAAYEAGASVSEVGKAMGVSPEAARRYLERQGVQRREANKHHGSGQQ
jgi:transposase-like protein